MGRPSTTSGQSVLITAGPTIERIDPIRFLSNFSSGKQGIALANAFAKAGYEVTLILGPSNEAIPSSIQCVQVESAQEMHDAVEKHLPKDIAICAAAVADWRPKHIAKEKLKKQPEQETLTLTLERSPDILHIISTHKHRPKLVIGFAAETEDLLKHAKEKLLRKECDIILANQISKEQPVFGQDNNEILWVDKKQDSRSFAGSKDEIATHIVQNVTDIF